MVENPKRAEARHPMAVVCRRTGLKPDLVRAWERRYGAVRPERSAGGRRLYSDAEIDRLRLLRRATEEGHPIRQVARMSKGELEELLAEARVGWAPTPSELAGDPGLSETLGACLSALEGFDSLRLKQGLDRAAVFLSRREWIEGFVVPLLHRVGELWQRGELRAAQEHLLTSQLRTAVGQLLDSYQTPSRAPCLLVCTPAGQVHELGALLVAATAAGEGWKALYLGADLPAEEIALAAERICPRAVALSVTWVEDRETLQGDVARLRQRLSPAIELLLGGRLAEETARELELPGIRTLPDLAALRAFLHG